MKSNWLMVMVAAASLLACGKSEEAAVAPPAEVPAPVAEPTTPPLPEEAPPAEAEPSAAAPAATAPQASTAEPAPTPAPTPAKPAPSAAAKAPEATPPAPAPKADLALGQQVYTKACAFCHDKGVAGAPKIGDAAAWSPRLAQGMDVLYAAAIKGKGAMPPKGGNPALTDADVKAAVDYLAAKSR